MDNKYLSEDQVKQFEGMLGGEGGLTPEQQEQAMAEGAAMAEQDMATAGGQPTPDGAAPVDAGAAGGLSPEVAQEFGVATVDELVALLRESSGKSAEYKDILTNLLAVTKAKENQQELDPSDPMNSVKRAIREEMAPIFDKLDSDARNKIVQDAWGEAAKEMPDLTDMMPDIAEYIKAHPSLAVSDDGLRRAYDGVRSAKYRSPEQLLGDDEFVQKAASDERVKNAVLSAHLNEITKNGEPVPPSIGAGGGSPLTGQKVAPTSMDQAKQSMLSLLGKKK